ncbi:hypothetical protein [Pseudomonas baetica]|uniref:hypothetical protein n=1 Tax=Pseudomonas baetica TaxID=674054 RepID=UPI0024064272|nr:hypothetical protein [Pseudomonas baetica]MDF9778978.1 hypothetical protein [Pseudomonas baetica]
MIRPGTFAPPPTLFLPLAEEVAGALSQNHDVSAFFAAASHAELACVLLLQNLPALVRQKVTLTKIEVMFEGAVRAGLAKVAPGNPTFASQVQARFDAAALTAGLAELQMQGISLLDAETIAAREYLVADGGWDFTFSQRHRQRLQPPGREVVLPSGAVFKVRAQQGRILDEFRTGLDESLHLQGYAGVGKTFLISKIFEFLNPVTTLLMAYLPSQLIALRARVHLPTNDAQLNSYTFGHMANLILNSDRTDQAWKLTDTQRAQTNYMVTDQQMAKWLKIQAVGRLSPKDVASLCRRTMFSFCMSASRDIEAKHLPATGYRLKEVDIAVLLEYSRLMWRETVWPSSPEIRFPVRNAHRIKYLALGTGTFPEKFTHIIVDESHEMSAPMLQILDRSPQAVLTLGDDYQHLHGMASQHSQLVRKRNITQSLRSGKQMGDVLNPFIQLHPGAVKEEFEGKAGYPTVIIPYDENSPIPEKPTTIIVANEWGLFTWFKKLLDADGDFHIPPRALDELKAFVAGLVQLHGLGVRASHRMLFKYGSWEELATAMGRNHGFLAAYEMLERGLTLEAFEQFTNDHCTDPGAMIKLARVDDVKNQEFNTVLISRDLMRPPKQGAAHSMASVCSMLYTAASRAKHELIVPGNLVDWTQDLARPDPGRGSVYGY